MSKKISHQFSGSMMMLPEHRSGLQEQVFRRQQETLCRRPLVDEQRLAEWQQILETALAGRRMLTVTLNSAAGCQTFSGLLLRADPVWGLLHLRSGEIVFTVKATDVLDLDLKSD